MIYNFIPRGPLGNSTAYENALAAINNAKNKANITPDEIYHSVQTVLKYLDKKEKVRTRPFGRVRWEQCMTFLKSTMPPEEFKAYCDKVNTKRGVSDHPEHPDYVSPESFGSTNYKEACEEAMDIIERGNQSPEDYATLFALRKMDATQPVNKKTLTLAKEQILQDPDFQLLSKKELIARLQYLAENNESDYTAHANHVKKSKQPQKQISG